MKTMLERGAGLLLPISSLPSPYGIGTLGQEAYQFADQLKEAGQKYWQVLPVGPTSYGDSPYQSFSAFAGNPYFIDLDFLIEEGLLERDFVKGFPWGDAEDDVDYGKIFESRFLVLKEAFKKSGHKETEEFQEFCKKNSGWLLDYSFYMACKVHFENREWLLWETDVCFREQEALNRYQDLLKDEIEFWNFCQFKFFQQWERLKEYCKNKGILIIGDIPIYVALDSADVWVHPELFQLDPETRLPLHVAGVPPDAFSEEGQLWGNPLYNWERMERDNFEWWKQRIKACADLYDVIRIDHFLGVVRYFSIPGDAVNGRVGEYLPGPDMKLVDAINSVLGDTKLIAEDLGVANERVEEILEMTHYPGMKVLEFAFDGSRDNCHLPHNYVPNTVVYGGTHDNETIAGHLLTRPDYQVDFMMNYLDISKKEDILFRLMAVAYASVASAAIFQVQDVLGLDNSTRMNFPSTIGTNWRWRLKKGQFERRYIERLNKLGDIYGRK